MQEAIRNYIDEESKKDISLDKISIEIDKVAKSEIEKARKKQLRRWRKMNYE
jgi:hypothetical protein